MKGAALFESFLVFRTKSSGGTFGWKQGFGWLHIVGIRSGFAKITELRAAQVSRKVECDALRYAIISMHLALFKSVGAVSLHTGNPEPIVRLHCLMTQIPALFIPVKKLNIVHWPFCVHFFKALALVVKITIDKPEIDCQGFWLSWVSNYD